MVKTITQGETLLLNAKTDPTATVTFFFAGASSQTVSGVQDSSDSTIFSIASDTSSWAPGGYICEIRSTFGSPAITQTLARLTLTILPQLTSIAAGTDVRTAAEIAVANIEAMLSGGATLEAKQYKINNRELQRYSIHELTPLLAYWKRRVGLERRQNRNNYGLAPRIESVM